MPRRPKTDYQITNQALSLFECTDIERRLVSFLNANGKNATWVHRGGYTLAEGLALELGASAVMVRRAIKSLRDRGWAKDFADQQGHPALALQREVLIEAVRLQELRQLRRWIGTKKWWALMEHVTPEERTGEGHQALLDRLHEEAINLDQSTTLSVILAGGIKARMAHVANNEILRRRG